MTTLSLARQFQTDLFVKKWQLRQCGVIASRPCSTQQDFILFHILNALGSSALRDKMASNLPVTENDTLDSPIFLELPKVNTDSFRVLLRTLAGLEDFARTNAHQPQRRRGAGIGARQRVRLSGRVRRSAAGDHRGRQVQR